MINLVFAWIGDKYSEDYFCALIDRFSSVISGSYTFHLITDNMRLANDFRIIDFDQNDTFLHYSAYPGWWAKMDFFRIASDLEDSYLFLDVDQILLKPLELLLDVDGDWVSSRDPMAWGGYDIGTAFHYIRDPELAAKIYTDYARNPVFDHPQGDQGWLGDWLKKHPEYTPVWLEEHFPNAVQSYRLNGLDKRPPSDDCVIVNFHGNPKPHEVVDLPGHEWVKNNWGIYR